MYIEEKNKKFINIVYLGESYIQNKGRIKHRHGRIINSFLIGLNSKNKSKE